MNRERISSLPVEDIEYIPVNICKFKFICNLCTNKVERGSHFILLGNAGKVCIVCVNEIIGILLELAKELNKKYQEVDNTPNWKTGERKFYDWDELPKTTQFVWIKMAEYIIAKDVINSRQNF